MIKGICFEGGGAAGIAHMGALEVLQEHDKLKDLTHFVGSSAGAIAAAALACREDVTLLKQTLFNTDFNSFFDDSFGYGRDVLRFLRDFGWYKGEKLLQWIEEVLENITGNKNITFQEVFERYHSFLEVTNTDINEVKSQTLYINHLTNPDMPVAKAVHRSALIPLFFRSACEKDKDDYTHYYCDGGVLDNYPLWRLSLYLPAEQCVGLKLISTSELNDVNLNNLQKDTIYIIDYIKLLITLLRTQALKSHVKSDDWKRTIAIDVGTISATDFDLDDMAKEHLIQQGKQAALKYLLL